LKSPVVDKRPGAARQRFTGGGLVKALPADRNAAFVHPVEKQVGMAGRRLPSNPVANQVDPPSFIFKTSVSDRLIGSHASLLLLSPSSHRDVGLSSDIVDPK
jgi:hypothetical protein